MNEGRRGYKHNIGWRRRDTEKLMKAIIGYLRKENIHTSYSNPAFFDTLVIVVFIIVYDDADVVQVCMYSQ